MEFKHSYTEAVTALKIYVYSQIVMDLLTELSNMPDVKNKVRYETACIIDIMSRQRKRLKRAISNEDLNAFDILVCDIADNSENSINAVRNSIKAELVQKLKYECIEPAVLTVMIGGMLDVIGYVCTMAKQKCNTDYNECLRYLNTIDRKMEFKSLNGEKPDYSKCAPIMSIMYQNITEEIKKKL